MKTTKQYLISGMAVFAMFAAVPLLSTAQGVTTPRTASPSAEVTQTLGISTITVQYSRPSVRDRDIWGSVVPYGWNVQGFGAGNEAPWRAGANENTTITFSEETTVEGTKVAAGTYGLFFVIDEGGKTGEVILSADTKSWGSFWYDPAQDVLRADISLRDIPHVETMTIDFINMGQSTAELVLNWEKKQFPVKLEMDVNAIVLANAKDELKGTTGFSWQGYRSAAVYLLQNNYELDQALAWIDIALQTDQSFGTKRVKAGILTSMGKKEEAEKMIASAVDESTEAELNAYGYQLVNQGNFEKAIEMFTLNTKRHPKSANAWDSLGEGYALKGDKDKAISSFKKSLKLDPAANVRANSEKYLKQLGAS